MRELVRTNDAVLISAIEALLNGARYRAYGGRSEYERAGRLDRHFPAPHPGRRGSNPRGAAAACRTPASATSYGRTLIESQLRFPPRMAEPARMPSSAAGWCCASRCAAIASATTLSCWRRRCRRSAGEHAVELGSGVGAAGLALARRIEGLAVTLVEIDPALTALARENAARNGLADARARGLSRRRGARRRVRRRGTCAGIGRSRADESAVQRAAKSVARSRPPHGADRVG